MFGYLRIFKPHMRFCEYDTYKAVYCGLCKRMGERFGLVSRFTLSYDMTFLALLEISLSEYALNPKKERCIAHPLKKSMCVHCEKGLDFSSDAAVLLTYHKLRDDMSDKGIKKKIASAILMPFMKKAYKKSSKAYSALSCEIEEQMKNQQSLERDNCRSLDRAADPTAKMTSAVFEGITDDEKKKRILSSMGYHLGRYIFFCDALDDVKDDYRKGSYNPLLAYKGIEKNEKELPDEMFRELRDIAKDAVMLSLGEMSNAYVLLEIKRYKDILDNIVYLGLRNTFKIIYNEDNITDKTDKEK